MSEHEDTVEISFVPDDQESEAEVTDKKKKTIPHKKTSPRKQRAATKKLQHQIDEQQKQLEAMVCERDDFKDKYLRNMAEIDNFRKRVKKEKEEHQKYVLSEFLLELLQVYDNLERALKARTPAEKKDSVLQMLKDDDEKSIVSGVIMIHKQFTDLLKKYNVVEIEALNKPFDPNLHQALSKDETEEVSEPTVVEVYQKGFTYSGKLLKPTLVKVAIPKEKEPEVIPQEPQQEDTDQAETDQEENNQ